MLNLDTHILISALTAEITPKENRLLATQRWSISAIVLWEITKLVQLKKIALDLGDPDFNRTLSKIHIWPITMDICRQIPMLDFRSDPADEIIAATSVVYRVPLLTRDKKIQNSKVVPLA